MGTRIQRQLHPGGSPATTDQEMVDLLKQAFQGFYRTSKGSTPTFHPRTEIHLANPHITESETQTALEALNPNKRAGPGGLFPKALKTLSPYIAPTFSLIFKLSLQIFQTPDDRRHAIVTSVAKEPRTQKTQTYSGSSAWRLLFAKCLKLFPKRRCLPICLNFHY